MRTDTLTFYETNNVNCPCKATHINIGTYTIVSEALASNGGGATFVGESLTNNDNLLSPDLTAISTGEVNITVGISARQYINSADTERNWNNDVAAILLV